MMVCWLLLSVAQVPALGPRALPSSAVYARLPAAAFSGELMVKFPDGTDVDVRGTRVLDADGNPLLDVAALLPAGSVQRVQRALGQPTKHLRALRAAAVEACQCDQADLSTYVHIHTSLTGDAMHAALDVLARQPKVEWVYPRARRARPPVDLPPATPLFVEQQAHLGPAPDGLGVLGVRSLPGGRGAGVKVVDVEVDWTDDHEDLPHCAGKQVPGSGTIYPDLEWLYFGAHGTAVLGVVTAADNPYGNQGMAPEADCWFAPNFTSEANTEDIPAALLAAVDSGAAAAGDVIMLESQAGGPRWDGSSDEGLVPSEWEPLVFDTLRSLAALGIIVVEAAGNGYQDLDDPIYQGRFDRTVNDSGALMAGAGFAPGPRSRERMPYSNHGTRVDLQGWGERVYTLGYGDLFFPGMDTRQSYTAEFAGTSSATPLVAGAVLLVQAIQLAGGGQRLTASQMRDLLVQTGTPQAGSAHIGPQPDVTAAVAGLAVCGNGRRDRTEACEDSNTLDGDGCSADCSRVEACGNGVVEPPEQCDDRNLADGDGCSAACRSEAPPGGGGDAPDPREGPLRCACSGAPKGPVGWWACALPAAFLRRRHLRFLR